MTGHDRFKSTLTLVTAFEARRLPRAYLVLLESLLNVKPSARPTCERVLNAIREGRVRKRELSELKSYLIIFAFVHSWTLWYLPWAEMQGRSYHLLADLLKTNQNIRTTEAPMKLSKPATSRRTRRFHLRWRSVPLF